MDKKGMQMVLSLTTKVIIGLVVIVIVSSIFFIGHDALLPKVKRLMPSLSKYLPDTGTNEFDYESRPAQEPAELSFKELYNAIDDLRMDDRDVCFYFFDTKKMESIMGNYDIEFITNNFGEPIPLKNPDGSVQKNEDGTDKTENPGYGVTMILRRRMEDLDESQKGRSEITHFRIPNIKPCLVYGDSEVSNFYKVWLTTKENYLTGLMGIKNANLKRPNLGIDQIKTFEEYEFMVMDHSIKVGDRELDFETVDEGAYVLYKVSKDHICFFPTHDGNALCDGDDDALDDDCFDRDADDSLYSKAKEFHYPLYEG